DYLAVFRPSNYRWLLPQLNDPTQMSQMSMTVGALLLIAIAVVELLPAIRRSTELSTRIGIYFCAAVIYYISVSGVASLDMASMLRYEFCVHALIVLAFLHFLRQFRVPPPLLRVFFDGYRGVGQRPRAECAGLVCLELYPRELGGLTKMKSTVAIIGAGPAEIGRA